MRHMCLACNYALASIVTVNDPLTDATPAGVDSSSDEVHLQAVPMCSSCYQALHYQPGNKRVGENGNNRSMLELRPGQQPSLVFPMDDYQIMATASSLDQVLKSSYF